MLHKVDTPADMAIDLLQDSQCSNRGVTILNNPLATDKHLNNPHLQTNKYLNKHKYLEISVHFFLNLPYKISILKIFVFKQR